jgi:outer membrane immunogenic protein
MQKLGAGSILPLIASVAALIFLGGAPASADGMRRIVGVSDLQGATNWSGIYAGGQLGGTWANIDWSQVNPNFFNTLGAAVVGTDSSFDASGVLGGVYGGYNHQVGHWVFGLELAATATDLTDSRASPFFPALDTYSTEVRWLATVAGRIGYAWDRWLVFGRGGWAGADVDLTLSSTAGPLASKDAWANGWTLGLGAEYMMWHGVSLGLAYDYVELNLDGETITCPSCGTGVGFGTPVIDSDIRMQSVMARVSFFLPGEGAAMLAPGR